MLTFVRGCQFHFAKNDILIIKMAASNPWVYSIIHKQNAFGHFSCTFSYAWLPDPKNGQQFRILDAAAMPFMATTKILKLCSSITETKKTGQEVGIILFFSLEQ